MSWRSLAGLLLFQLFLLGIGVTLLWAVRGFRSLAEVVRLAGVAYLGGLASYGIVSVLVLVLGIPYRLPTILLIGAVLAAGAVGFGIVRGRTVPPLHGASGFAGMTLAAAPFAALVVVLLEALFRRGRLEGLFAYDAWAFWVPKAEAIHRFGGLDEEFFRTLPGPSYPPLVPALEASAFHFMGSVDVVTLHLFFVGPITALVGSVVGLLGPRVRPLLLWPPLVLLLASPELVERALLPQADVLLDCLFGLAVLLVALWVVERSSWLLATAALLLAACGLTKREGLLLTACVLVAAGVACWPRRRSAWPALLTVAGAVILAGIPWRLWFGSRDLPGEGPEAGGSGLLDHLDRLWPSVRLAGSSLLDFDLWPLIVPAAVAALVLVLLAGARSLAVYVGTLLGLCLLGFAWVMWSFPSLPLTKDQSVSPIVRLTGAGIVAAAVVTPLLLERGWGTPFADSGRPDTRALALVLVAAVAYPLASSLHGARFPTRAECARPASDDGSPVEIVYGRSDSQAGALELRDRVVAVGFVGTDVAPDRCGRWRVYYDGVDSFAQAQGTMAEARGAGFAPELEVRPS